MKTHSTIERLLKGSQNIDRMKLETEQFVRMLVGLCVDKRSTGRTIDETFDCGDAVWDVVGETDNFLRVNYRMKGRGGICGFGLNPSAAQFSDSAIVQTVYEALPKFLSGMLDTFPELAQKWAAPSQGCGCVC